MLDTKLKVALTAFIITFCIFLYKYLPLIYDDTTLYQAPVKIPGVKSIAALFLPEEGDKWDTVFVEYKGDSKFSTRSGIYKKMVDAYKKDTTPKLSDNEDKLLYKKATEILENILTADMGEFDKEKAINDYIVKNTAYYTGDDNPADIHNAHGPILYNRGVCDGYTRAVMLLLKMADIECSFVTGEAKNTDDKGFVSHAWAIVKIDAAYYHLDVTWNDPVPDKANEVSYGYFNVPDSLLLNNHIWDKTKYPPCVSTQSEYYTYSGLYITQEEFVKQLANAILNHRGYIEYRVQGLTGNTMADGLIKAASNKVKYRIRSSVSFKYSTSSDIDAVCRVELSYS